MNFENIFAELKEHLRKILVNLSFILPFWALAIFITKPSFLNNPIHIQFILTFCLSSMWLLIYFLITVAFITIFKKENIVKTLYNRNQVIYYDKNINNLVLDKNISNILAFYEKLKSANIIFEKSIKFENK